MSSRKIRYYNSSTGQTETAKFTFDKNKRYKWNKSTGAIEEATTLAADELTIAGSKSSLRRLGDLERNVSILASKAGVVAADNDDTDAVQKDSSRALRSYTPITASNDTITLHLGDGSTASASISDANTNYYTSAVSFNTTNGVLTMTGAGGRSNLTVDLDGRYAYPSDITTAINNLVDGAPAALNTLNELAAAIGDNASYASSITTALSGKASTGTVMTAGNGLTGGGNLGANRTFHVGAGNGISVSADGVAMSGSYTGSFTATGDITAYSDDSLKTNVQVIDGALGKVEAIRGVTFERIEDGSVSTGVIAQELEAVLPEAVKVDEAGLRHVAYGNITGLLIEAVKELSAQVAELKAKQ